MREVVCIICPNSCKISIDEEKLLTTGNKCVRGHDYAISEITCPKRTICTTMKTIFSDYPVISVKTSKPIKKGLINEAMKIINNTVIDKKLSIESVVIKNILNENVDIITTSDMKGE